MLEYVGRLRDVEPDTDLSCVHEGYASVTLLTKVGAEPTAPGLAEAVAQTLS